MSPGASSVSQLSIIQPDDFHVHLRSDDLLPLTVDHISRQFARAIVMPNLRPPVTTAALAANYREDILAAIPPGRSFEPMMTLYLTDRTRPEDIREAKRSGFIFAVKYYPAGATTNSDSGVTDLKARGKVFEALTDVGMPLLVHGEVTDPSVDVFDREKKFIDSQLSYLKEEFPGMKIVLEHITTEDAVQFVDDAPKNIAATITAHHLLINRNSLFVGGINPHHYCLPVVKRERHRLALLDAATSGSAKYFLGTDSAPHERATKESACGCAGIYSALTAMELYAEAFDSVGKLEALECFSSINGANFYGLERNKQKATLRRKIRQVPEELPYQLGTIVPFRSGGAVDWSFSLDEI